MRTGTDALSLLAAPINVHVVEALAEQPTALIDLRRAAGSPPPTTIRKHLRRLTEMGAIERRREGGFPGSVGYELSRAGRDLLGVTKVLRLWLADSPTEPLALGSPAAKSAIKALAEGWSTNVIRALAARPLSLTELNRLISGVSYPSLERRLVAMKLAGQIEACAGGGRGTPYAVTSWLRRAVAPIVAAARWERQHQVGETPAIGRLDIEAAFLLMVPLLNLPPESNGSCRLTVEIRGAEGELSLAGVMVGIEEGKVVSCAAKLQGQASAWASGSAATWIRNFLENDSEQIDLGGDFDLARSVVGSLHAALLSPGKVG